MSDGTHTYRVALIGCGRVGSEWDPVPPLPLTHAGAYATHPRTRLVAGANRGRDRLEAFGRKWGVTALYLDYRQMLERERLDVVCVATHPELHHEQVIAAAQAGAKAIFCEKPMAISLAEADEMIEACERTGTILAMNHSRRWDPVHVRAKELVEAGEIGQLLRVVGRCLGCKPYPGWRAETEGPLLHDGTHSLDLLRMFAGDPEWVIATAVRRQRPFRVEDESLSIFQFRSGITGTVETDELVEFTQFDFELVGSRGKIQLGTGGDTVCRIKRSSGAEVEEDPNIEWWDLDSQPFPRVSPNTPMQMAADNLIHCLDTGASPRSTGYDGRAAMEMIMGIYESQRRGNAKVTFPLPSGPSSLQLMRDDGLL